MAPEWAKGRGIWIIADEIYRRIHYAPGPAPSFLDLSDELLDRVVIITGASKSYAMTGWRIGFALAPPDLAKAMAALQTHVTSGASHPSQCAAAEAFGNERVEADVSRMVDQFRSRRDLIVGKVEKGRRRTGRVMNTLGLILCSPNNPTGSVYTLTELKAIAEWAKGRGIWIFPS